MSKNKIDLDTADMATAQAWLAEQTTLCTVGIPAWRMPGIKCISKDKDFPYRQPEVCSNCRGTREVPLIPILKKLWSKINAWRAAGCEDDAEAFEAAFSMSCMEWLLERTAVLVRSQGGFCSIGEKTENLLVKPLGGGYSLPAAIVQATVRKVVEGL